MSRLTEDLEREIEELKAENDRLRGREADLVADIELFGGALRGLVLTLSDRDRDRFLAAIDDEDARPSGSLLEAAGDYLENQEKSA